MKKFSYLFAVLLVGLAVFAGTTNFSAIQIDPTSADSTAFRINNTSGTSVFSVSNSGVVASSGALSATAAGGLTLANSESLNTDTDAVFDFTRNTAGTVSITASDDNAVAALTVLPGGAAALTLGGASTTSLTVITDGTGGAEVVLPDDSIGFSELGLPNFGSFLICGDAVTVNNNTVYYAPSGRWFGASGCDIDAVGDTTETNADGVAIAAGTVEVRGMTCDLESDDFAGVTTFTLRLDESALNPSTTLSVGASSGLTRYLASGGDNLDTGLVSLAVASAADIGASSGFVCEIFFAY